MQQFHFSQFQDIETLIQQKSGQKISVCIPTLNEAATIGSIVSCIHETLVSHHKLVDEIIVMDSGSQDDTLEIAAAAGAKVFLAAEVSSHLGNHSGKGENLWKSLHVAAGDIICYIDGDITNFHTGFITGLIGPLLGDSAIDYVKAFYQRPLNEAGESISNNGGRVSEILIRPLLSLFYPELCQFIQPLAGEYAARRHLLESLAFPTGYGVEIAHLIDLANTGKLNRVAQTDLIKRFHRNRSDEALGSTSFAILKVILRRLERDNKLTLTNPLTNLYQSWLLSAETAKPHSQSIPEIERPPARSSL